MRLLTLVSLFVVCLLTISCARQEPTSTTAAPVAASASTVTAQVHGFVLVTAGQEQLALPDIRVALRRTGSDADVATVSTDESGLYAFTGVAPGSYRVCAIAPGYRGACTEGETAVAEADVFALDLDLVPEGRVARGRITLEDGSPCAFSAPLFDVAQHATVVAVDAAGKELGQPVRTTPTGDYLLAGLPEGDVTIRAACGPTTISAAANAPQMRLAVGRAIPADVPIVATAGGRRTTLAEPGTAVSLHADVTGATVQWKATGAAAAGLVTAGNDATWTAPSDPGVYVIYALATDGRGDYGTGRVDLAVGIDPKIAPLLQFTPAALRARVTIPTPGIPFLTKKGVGSFDQAIGYYEFIDPQQKRRSIGEWWALMGFDPNTGKGGDRAAYVNDNDLGFGRDMHCLTKGSTVACYVTNYGKPDKNPANADLAYTADPKTAGATVAMEYSPIEGLEGSGPIVKFFVYGGRFRRARRCSSARTSTAAARSSFRTSASTATAGTTGPPSRRARPSPR